MGAVLHEPNFPAATAKSHFTLPELTSAQPDIRQPGTNRDFLDNINISLGPPWEIPVPDLDHNLNFQSELSSGRPDPLPLRPGTNPRITVADRKLNYQLFGSGDFAFKLNLAPAYPNREGVMPTGIDPGFGITLKF